MCFVSSVLPREIPREESFQYLQCSNPFRILYSGVSRGGALGAEAPLTREPPQKRKGRGEKKRRKERKKVKKKEKETKKPMIAKNI